MPVAAEPRRQPSAAAQEVRLEPRVRPAHELRSRSRSRHAARVAAGRPAGSASRCSRSFATSIQAITPRPPARGGGGLPGLGRVGPPPESPEHPRPIGGEALVGPAGAGVPRRAAVQPDAPGPARAARRGRSRARHASRERGARPPNVGRTVGVHHASRSSSTRSRAIAGPTGVRPNGSRTGGAGAEGVVEAGERVLVALLPAVGARRGRRGRRAAPVRGPPDPRSPARRGASSSPSDADVLLVVDDDARERVDRAAAQHVEVDGPGSPSPRRRRSARRRAARPRRCAAARPPSGGGTPAARTAGGRGGRRARAPRARPAGSAPRSAASRSRARCSSRATRRA